MKLKKSALLLIALFSVTVGCMHAQGGGSDSASSYFSQDDHRDGEEISDDFVEIAGSGTTTSSDSEEEEVNDNDSGSDTDSEGDGNAEWASNAAVGQLYTPENSDDKDSFLLLSGEEDKEVVNPSILYNSDVLSTHIRDEESQANFNPHNPPSSPLLIVHPARRDSGSCKILGSVAAIVVIGYILRKLFSGSKTTRTDYKKTRNQRRVMPAQRAAGSYS